MRPETISGQQPRPSLPLPPPAIQTRPSILRRLVFSAAAAALPFVLYALISLRFVPQLLPLIALAELVAYLVFVGPVVSFAPVPWQLRHPYLLASLALLFTVFLLSVALGQSPATLLRTPYPGNLIFWTGLVLPIVSSGSYSLLLRRSVDRLERTIHV